MTETEILETEALIEGVLKEDRLVIETGRDHKCMKQFVASVVKNAKFPLSQLAVNLFTVVNVSQNKEITQPLTVLKEEVMEDPSFRRRKCLALYVIAAEKGLNFPLSQMAVGQSIVVNALKEKTALQVEVIIEQQINIKSNLIC